MTRRRFGRTRRTISAALLGPVLGFFADIPATTPVGATVADGQLSSGWSVASSVSGAPRLVTDAIAGGAAIRTSPTDLLSTSAGAASFLDSGACTMVFVWRYRANATGRIDPLLDTTEGGTKAGIQVQIGDQVGSIFYGRSISVRQFDGASWSFDAISIPGAIMSGAFIPLKWQVVVIRLSDTQLDISVDGQSVNIGGWSITRSYVAGTTGKLAIGGGYSDYKAVALYNYWMADVAKISVQTSLAARFPLYMSLVLQGDQTMTVSSQSASFPYLSKLPASSLYATSYNGIDGPKSSDHNDAFLSLDGGHSWSAPVVLTTSAVTLYSDLKTSDPLSDGSIIQVTMTYDVGLAFVNVRTRRAATFDGSGNPIWGAWVDVLTGTPAWSATQCPPVEDPTNLGTLHMAVFTKEGSGDAFTSAWDYKNTIAGVIAGTPWTRTIAANGMTDSRLYEEPFLWFEGSEIRMLIRDGTTNGTTPMRATHSTNSGVTYAANVTVNLPAWSSGQQVRKLASGRRVWVGRQTGSSNKGALFWQAAGAIWSDPWNSAKLEIDPLFGGMYYAGLVEQPTGSLVILMSRSAGNGHNNNNAIYQIPEWILDFAMPGSVSPITKTLARNTTQQLTVTGAGDYVYAITSDTSGGATVSASGLFTAGPAAGTVVFTVKDLNASLSGVTLATCTYTVT